MDQFLKKFQEPPKLTVTLEVSPGEISHRILLEDMLQALEELLKTNHVRVSERISGRMSAYFTGGVWGKSPWNICRGASKEISLEIHEGNSRESCENSL